MYILSLKFFTPILIILLSGCANDFDKSRNSAPFDKSKDPVFVVGDISFTYKEYFHFIRKQAKYLNIDLKKNKLESMITTWENNFVEQSLLFSEAARNGYDKNSFTLDMNERMARYIVLQPRGILADHITKKEIIVSPKMLTEAKNKRDIHFELEYMHFTSAYDMNNFLKPVSPIKDGKTFSEYVEKLNKDQNVVVGEISWNWLSKQYVDVRDIIFEMEAGDISDPIPQNDGILLVHVVSKESKKRKHRETAKSVEILKKYITKAEREKLLFAFDKWMYDAAEITITDKNVSTFWNMIKDNSISTFDTFQYAKYANLKLMSYRSPTQEHSITVADFMQHYNDLVVGKTLRSKQRFLYYLKDIAWESQALPFARKAGLFEGEKFLLDKKFHKIRVAISTFLNDKVGEISQNDIVKRYEANKHRYRESDSLAVTIYAYDTKEQGFEALTFLLGKNFSSRSTFTTKLKPLNTTNEIIAIETPGILSPKTMQKLKHLDGAIFPELVQFDRRKFAILIKNGLIRGNIKSLVEMKGSISNQIERERREPLKMALLQELRKSPSITSLISEIRIDVIEDLLK